MSIRQDKPKCLKCGYDEFRYGEWESHKHVEPYGKLWMLHELQQMFCSMCGEEHYESRARVI